MKYDIFISYRRGGGKNIARMLRETLSSKGYNVFLDFDELKDGYFDEKIMHAIDEAPIFILILSKGSMARCVDENDWVRKEIEYALSKNKQIVPIDPDKEFDGFPEEMPNDLKENIGQHQFSVLDTSQLFTESINKMDRDRLSPIVRRTRIQRMKWLKYLGGAIFLILLIVGSQFYVKHLGEKHAKLGTEYIYGTNGVQDYELALKHFRKSAKLGNATGEYCIGVSYFFGEGVEESNEKAYSYFLKSYKHAKPEIKAMAAYYLGLLTMDGKVCERDFEKAYTYFHESTQMGDADGPKELGKLFYNPESPYFNLDSALYWYQIAADKDDASSCLLLGGMYIFGQSVPQDVNKGIEYLERGANLGDASCANLLVYAYETLSEYEKAFYYATISAKKDDAEGLYHMGRFYYEGKGVERDEAIGVLSLMSAKQKGNDSASLYFQSLPSHYAIPTSCEDLSKQVQVQLIYTDNSSTKIYLQFNRTSVSYMNFVVDGQAYLEDLPTGAHYNLLRTYNCKLYPETNMVIDRDFYDFCIEFEPIPQECTTLTMVAQNYDNVIWFTNLSFEYVN